MTARFSFGGFFWRKLYGYVIRPGYESYWAPRVWYPVDSWWKKWDMCTFAFARESTGSYQISTGTKTVMAWSDWGWFKRLKMLAGALMLAWGLYLKFLY